MRKEKAPSAEAASPPLDRNVVRELARVYAHAAVDALLATNAKSSPEAKAVRKGKSR